MKGLHKELHFEIEIQVSDGRVWQILTDFASFSQWNPSSGG